MLEAHFVVFNMDKTMDSSDGAPSLDMPKGFASQLHSIMFAFLPRIYAVIGLYKGYSGSGSIEGLYLRPPFLHFCYFLVACSVRTLRVCPPRSVSDKHGLPKAMFLSCKGWVYMPLATSPLRPGTETVSVC